MAQVPYSPVPDASLNLQPTPEMHVNSPVDAFGGSVGKSIESLGGVMEHASGEIFARAQAMQAIKNETDTRRQSVLALKDISDATAQFQTQYGEHAGPEQYQKFMQGVSDIREKYRAGLSSPDAQKLYDAESFRYVGNAIMSGGRHSADQLKQQWVTTNKMQQAAHIDAIAADPLNQQSVQDNLDGIEKRKRAEMDTAGISDPAVVAEEVAKARSAGVSAQVNNLLDKGDIGHAKFYLDKYTKEGSLRGVDQGTLIKHLQTQESVVGPKVIGDGLRDGINPAFGDGKVSSDRAAAAVRQIESSDNYALLTGDVGHRKIGAYSILEPYLKDYLKQAGLDTSMSPEEFIKHPELQDKVFQTVYADGIAKGHTANEIAGRWQQGHYEGEGRDVTDANKVDRAGYTQRFNAALYKTASLEERTGAAASAAEKMNPDHPTLQDAARNNEEIRFHHEQSDAKAAMANQWSGIYTSVEAQKGQGPMTLDVLMAKYPDFAAAYKGLGPKDQLKTQSYLIRAGHEDTEETQGRLDNYNRLLGQAYVDPDGFKAADFTKENLTDQQRKSLIGVHAQALKGPLEDPAVKKALSDLSIRDIAFQAGAGPKSGEEWLKFSGALAEEIKFARAGGKSPTMDDITGMAKKLVQAKPGSGWGGSDFMASPRYQIPLHGIPDSMIKQSREKLAKKYADEGSPRDPTDQDIEQHVAMSIYAATVAKAKTNGK